MVIDARCASAKRPYLLGRSLEQRHGFRCRPPSLGLRPYESRSTMAGCTGGQIFESLRVADDRRPTIDCRTSATICDAVATTSPRRSVPAGSRGARAAGVRRRRAGWDDTWCRSCGRHPQSLQALGRGEMGGLRVAGCGAKLCGPGHRDGVPLRRAATPGLRQLNHREIQDVGRFVHDFFARGELRSARSPSSRILASSRPSSVNRRAGVRARARARVSGSARRLARPYSPVPCRSGAGARNTCAAAGGKSHRRPDAP